MEPQFECTICGQIGSVGRCCGLETPKPLNDAAAAEIAANTNKPPTEAPADGAKESE